MGFGGDWQLMTGYWALLAGSGPVVRNKAQPRDSAASQVRPGTYAPIGIDGSDGGLEWFHKKGWPLAQADPKHYH